MTIFLPFQFKKLQKIILLLFMIYLLVQKNYLTKNKLFGGGSYENAVLTIYVPVGTVFENVNITTGAGRLTVDNLSAETIDFELGAGEVSIGSLVATKSADIEGGAGRITVSAHTKILIWIWV